MKLEYAICKAHNTYEKTISAITIYIQNKYQYSFVDILYKYTYVYKQDSSKLHITNAKAAKRDQNRHISYRNVVAEMQHCRRCR